MSKYTDPDGGPAVDKDGNGIFENYMWNGTSVTENEFFAAVASTIDVEKMEEVK